MNQDMLTAIKCMGESVAPEEKESVKESAGDLDFNLSSDLLDNFINGNLTKVKQAFEQMSGIDAAVVLSEIGDTNPEDQQKLIKYLVKQKG